MGCLNVRTDRWSTPPQPGSYNWCWPRGHQVSHPGERISHQCQDYLLPFSTVICMSLFHSQGVESWSKYSVQVNVTAIIKLG